LNDRRWLRTRVAYDLWRLHRDDEAIAVDDQLITEAKDDPRQAFRYLRDKATIFRLADRYSDALETWNVAIQLVKPGTVDWESAQSWRTTLLEKLGRVDDACAEYKVLIASKVVTPVDRAFYLAEMAKILEKNGLHAAALDAAAQAQQILKGEVKSADGHDASVAQIQSHIDKITGAPPAQPSDKKPSGKTNP
jgi:tetratricopeptide (TPR) repeat protein